MSELLVWRKEEFIKVFQPSYGGRLEGSVLLAGWLLVCVPAYLLLPSNCPYKSTAAAPEDVCNDHERQSILKRAGSGFRAAVVHFVKDGDIFLNTYLASIVTNTLWHKQTGSWATRLTNGQDIFLTFV